MEISGKQLSSKETKLQLEEVNEKLLTALSLIMILETDLTVERSDGVYYRAVKVIHGIIDEAQQGIKTLF